MARKRRRRRPFSKGPAFVGVAGTRAEFYNRIGEGVSRAVEGVPGEVSLGGGADEIGGLDGGPGSREEGKEPAGTEAHQGQVSTRLLQAVLNKRGVQNCADPRHIPSPENAEPTLPVHMLFFLELYCS